MNSPPRAAASISSPARSGWLGAACSNATSCCFTTRNAGPLYPVRGVLLNVFVWWTKIIYRRLARKVARDVADYQKVGIAVDGIVGIGASPSCGVTTTLDLRASLELVAACPRAAQTRDVMNERAVLGWRSSGEGLFIKALDRELKRRRLIVPAFEHDLAAELRGEQQAVFVKGERRMLGKDSSNLTDPSG